jgi:hypothetical protein
MGQKSLPGGLQEITSAVGGEQSEESSPQIIFCFGATTRVELNTFVTWPSVWCVEVSVMIKLQLGGQIYCGWSLAEERDLSLLQSKPGSGMCPVPCSLCTGSSSCSSKWPGTKLPTLLHQLLKFRMHGTLYLQSSVNLHGRQTDHLYLYLFNDVQ